MYRNRIPFLMVIALDFAVTLAGCARDTGVVRVGNNHYMISRQDLGETSGGRVKVELVKQAEAFCSASGQSFELVTSSSEDWNDTKNWSSAEIQFMCK